MRRVKRVAGLCGGFAAAGALCACASGGLGLSPSSVSNFAATRLFATQPRRSEFPPTPAGIHLNLVFNYRVKNVRREAGVVDMVWGAGAPRPRQVANQFYTPFERDGPYGEHAHSLRWWKAHHPDWIEYRCDRTNVAFEFGERDVPLDIGNPAVLRYQRAAAVDPAIAAGYQGIDFDNLDLSNYSHRCGHYSSSGGWVAQYTGKYVDSAYLHDVLAWGQSTYAYIHAFSSTAIMAINFSYDSSVDAAHNDDLATHADEVLDEGGFTNYGSKGNNVTSPQQWRSITGMIHAVQGNGGCYVENGEEPGLSKNISQSERLWVVTNYLIIRDDCTYVWISGYTRSGAQDYGRILLYPEYRLAVGKPQGTAAHADGAWQRTYSGGLALVNPQHKPIVVPLTGKYVDENGKTYSESIRLSGTSGEIILRK